MYFMNGIHKRPNPTKRTVVIRPTATSRCSLASGRSLRYTSHVSSVEQERSEEHTSELQSRGHLVCRLLLEKKKGTVRELVRLAWMLECAGMPYIEIVIYVDH